jgi:mannose-6-phosphate isomerase-like protein (cupin superfamily)
MAAPISDKVNLSEAFSAFSDHWSPQLVGEVNDFQVKLAKFSGDFVWHHHDDEDELFMVVSGRLLMRFRDREVWVEEGEFIIVPAGVEHCPSAPEEAHVILLEKGTIVRTGD